jgi:hypothetical protein
MKEIHSPDPSVRAALRGALVGCLLLGPPALRLARGEPDPASAVTAVEYAIAETKAGMSAAGRQAHEAEINQALARIKELADLNSHASSDRTAADQRVARCNAEIEAAQNQLTQLREQMRAEVLPYYNQGKDAEAERDAWNAKYAGKSFTQPEPYNSILAEQQRISAKIDYVNAKGEEIMARYQPAKERLEAAIAARQQEYADAVSARDQLNRTLLTQAQQFQDAIRDLTDKLLIWVKESPAPAPGSGLDFKSGDALDQLMRAFNQGPAMASTATDQHGAYAPARDASSVVFDRQGGTGGALVVVTDKGPVPAPAEVQNSAAVRAVVEGLSAAQNAVNEAQKRWNEVIHDRAATPQQIQEADRILTRVTSNFVQLKYEQQQATSLLGRSAPGHK